MRRQRAFAQLAQLQNAIGHKSELRPLAPTAIGLGAEAPTRRHGHKIRRNLGS